MNIDLTGPAVFVIPAGRGITSSLTNPTEPQRFCTRRLYLQMRQTIRAVQLEAFDQQVELSVSRIWLWPERSTFSSKQIVGAEPVSQETVLIYLLEQQRLLIAA